MTKLQVNGVDVAYTVAGDGPPVVLLHAGIADRSMWEDVMPMLADRFRVIACDLRGFGETPLPDGPFAYAADVVAIGHGVEHMRELGAQRASRGIDGRARERDDGNVVANVEDQVFELHRLPQGLANAPRDGSRTLALPNAPSSRSA